MTMTEEERQGLSGPAIGDAIRKRRLAAVDVVKASASTLQPG